MLRAANGTEARAPHGDTERSAGLLRVAAWPGRARRRAPLTRCKPFRPSALRARVQHVIDARSTQKQQQVGGQGRELIAVLINEPPRRGGSKARTVRMPEVRFDRKLRRQVGVVLREGHDRLEEAALTARRGDAGVSHAHAHGLPRCARSCAHYGVSGGPMMQMSHSKGSLSSTSPAEKPSTGLLFKSGHSSARVSSRQARPRVSRARRRRAYRALAARRGQARHGEGDARAARTLQLLHEQQRRPRVAHAAPARLREATSA